MPGKQRMPCMEKEGVTFREIMEELVKAMNAEKDADRKLVDEYFKGSIPGNEVTWLDKPFRSRWFACFVATSESREAHYIHVDAYPFSEPLAPAFTKPCQLALGKTYRGWSHAWKIAKRAATLLGT